MSPAVFCIFVAVCYVPFSSHPLWYDGIIPLWGLRIDNGPDIHYTTIKGVKIAVLFGSFNPITNAHVAILKAAVAHLGADRGLFVVTNGKYLKKKTVKIGDPFYREFGALEM